MHLIVDIESSDLLKRGVVLDDPSQPWVVSVAALLVDDAGNDLDFMSTRILANGRKVRAGAEAVHGISSGAAARAGIDEIPALGFLCGLAAQASFVVGHGITFDRDVVIGVLMRRGKNPRMWTRPGLASLCTMKAAAPFCRLEPVHESGGYRWPSLDVACQMLLGEPLRDGFHTAFDDVQRTKRLWKWLIQHRAFDIAKVA